jgi:hypothetical protein
MSPLETKYLGRCSFTNSWEVVSQVSSFPADLWQLIEKKAIAMVTTDVDKVEVTDPEGTNVSWDVSEEMAKRWVRGIYWRGHLLMYPDSTIPVTGIFGRSPWAPTPNIFAIPLTFTVAAPPESTA